MYLCTYRPFFGNAVQTVARYIGPFRRVCDGGGRAGDTKGGWDTNNVR